MLQLLHLFRENREVMLFTKKRSEVGGQRVNKVLPLRIAVIVQPPKVDGKRFHIQRPQSARQAAVHHVYLAVAERDTGMAVDELFDALKIL